MSGVLTRPFPLTTTHLPRYLPSPPALPSSPLFAPGIQPFKNRSVAFLALAPPPPGSRYARIDSFAMLRPLSFGPPTSATQRDRSDASASTEGIIGDGRGWEHGNRRAP